MDDVLLEASGESNDRVSSVEGMSAGSMSPVKGIWFLWTSSASCWYGRLPSASAVECESSAFRISTSEWRSGVIGMEWTRVEEDTRKTRVIRVEESIMISFGAVWG